LSSGFFHLPSTAAKDFPPNAPLPSVRTINHKKKCHDIAAYRTLSPELAPPIVPPHRSISLFRTYISLIPRPPGQEDFSVALNGFFFFLWTCLEQVQSPSVLTRLWKYVFFSKGLSFLFPFLNSPSPSPLFDDIAGLAGGASTFLSPRPAPVFPVFLGPCGHSCFFLFLLTDFLFWFFVCTHHGGHTSEWMFDPPLFLDFLGRDRAVPFCFDTGGPRTFLSLHTTAPPVPQWGFSRVLWFCSARPPFSGRDLGFPSEASLSPPRGSLRGRIIRESCGRTQLSQGFFFRLLLLLMRRYMMGLFSCHLFPILLVVTPTYFVRVGRWKAVRKSTGLISTWRLPSFLYFAVVPHLLSFFFGHSPPEPVR